MKSSSFWGVVSLSRLMRVVVSCFRSSALVRYMFRMHILLKLTVNTIVLVVEKILRSARAVQVAAPSTDQSRTLDIPILFHMLGLVIQINSSSTRVSLAVKVWAKTRQCSANLGDPTARCWIPNPLPHSSYGSLALFETYYGRQNTLRSTCMIG